MSWKELLSDQSGMTLIEVVAAGVILLIASLMVAKGFLFAGNLMERSIEIQNDNKDAKSAAEIGENPVKTEECQLIIGEGTLTVIVEEYGSKHNVSDSVFKVIRTID